MGRRGKHAVAAELDGVFIEKGGVAASLFLNVLDRLNDLVNRAYTKNGIDLGEFLEDCLTVALGHTTRDDDALEALVFLEPRNIKDIVDGFLFCRLDEGAGVDDDNIGFGLVGRDLISRLEKVVKHYLGVKLIFRTAERNKSYFHKLTNPSFLRTFESVLRA